MRTFIKGNHITFLGYMLLSLIAFSVVLSGLASHRQSAENDKVKSIVSCQAQLNEQFLSVIKSRANLAGQDRDALLLFFRTLADHPNDKVVGKIAFDKYLATERQLDKERQNFPPLPASTCE